VVRTESPFKLDILACRRGGKLNRCRDITARIAVPRCASGKRVVGAVSTKNADIAVLNERTAGRENVLETAGTDLDLKNGSVPARFRIVAVAETERRGRGRDRDRRRR